MRRFPDVCGCLLLFERQLCGQEDAHESYCLDLCSGYEGELSGVDDYTYRYYSVSLFCSVLFFMSVSIMLFVHLLYLRQLNMGV